MTNKGWEIKIQKFSEFFSQRYDAQVLNRPLTDDEKTALATAAGKVLALRNAIVNAASIRIQLGAIDDAFASPKNRPINNSILSKAKTKSISNSKSAMTLALAIEEHMGREILPRPIDIDAESWANLCADQRVSTARERAVESAKRLIDRLHGDGEAIKTEAELETPDERLLRSPNAPAQEHTDRLVRMWFFWGGHNAQSNGERRFMIQLQFDTELDVVEGQECEFRLNRCRIEVACRQAQVRHDPSQRFVIDRHDGDRSKGLMAVPDTGGYGAATSAGWSISSVHMDAPMEGKFEAVPFGIIEGPPMDGDTARLYFRLRDLDVSGAQLPPDETGEQLARQWLRRCMIPSAVGGRVVVSAQELSDEV